jgi:hypothetical protein
VAGAVGGAHGLQGVAVGGERDRKGRSGGGAMVARRLGYH